MFNLEKRKLWAYLIVAFQYLRGAYKQERKQLFTWSNSDRTKRNGFKVKKGRFTLDVRRKIFTQLMRHWNRLREKL